MRNKKTKRDPDPKDTGWVTYQDLQTGEMHTISLKEFREQFEPVETFKC